MKHSVHDFTHGGAVIIDYWFWRALSRPMNPYPCGLQVAGLVPVTVWGISPKDVDALGFQC